ncbi:uncharacterized protein [Amphiura filiformis]|uniref:uncharacterized protein n=1 Tax=Amphiura filiformis TaxID=82378 RepID=UPI003B2133A8
MEELRTMLVAMKLENHQNFAKITSQLDQFQKDFSSLKTDVTDLTLSVEHLDAEVSEIKDETIPDLRKQLQKEIDNLKKARITAELYSKKSNLLFYGIPESPLEDTEAVLRTFLTVHMNYERAQTVIFANVHRLPSKNLENTRPSPIIAKFLEMKIRNDILDKAKKLKKSPQKIGISPHLPAEMQTARAQLLPVKQQAIKDGKRAYIKTTGIEVKLYIDNELYRP